MNSGVLHLALGRFGSIRLVSDVGIDTVSAVIPRDLSLNKCTSFGWRSSRLLDCLEMSLGIPASRSDKAIASSCMGVKWWAHLSLS